MATEPVEFLGPIPEDDPDTPFDEERQGRPVLVVSADNPLPVVVVVTP